MLTTAIPTDSEPPPIIFNEFNLNSDIDEHSWKKQYRSKGIQLQTNSLGKEKIRQSFKNYSFSNSKGILQYAGLPFNKYLRKTDPVTGLTALYKLKNISQNFGANIYIKNEGQNPSGCFKDRESIMCLLHAASCNQSGTVVFSSGNAAISAAIYTQKRPFQTISFVSGDTYPEKIDCIRKHGSHVIVIGDKNVNFETGYRLFCELDNPSNLSSDKTAYFKKIGFDNWSVRNPYRVLGDKTIALEIVKQLNTNKTKPDVPDFIVVPSANGSCLSGIWKGFKELFAMQIIDKLPAMVSVGIRNASPIFGAVQKKQTKKPYKCSLNKVEKKDSRFGSIILAEEGYDSIQGTKAIIESGGQAIEVGWKDIKTMYSLFLNTETDLLNRYDVLPEPASLTALAAIKQLELGKSDKKIVAILTGNAIKARKKVLDLVNDKKNQKLTQRILNIQQNKMYPGAKRKGKQIETKANLKSVKAAFMRLQD